MDDGPRHEGHARRYSARRTGTRARHVLAHARRVAARGRGRAPSRSPNWFSYARAWASAGTRRCMSARSAPRPRRPSSAHRAPGACPCWSRRSRPGRPPPNCSASTSPCFPVSASTWPCAYGAACSPPGSWPWAARSSPPCGSPSSTARRPCPTTGSRSAPWSASAASCAPAPTAPTGPPCGASRRAPRSWRGCGPPTPCGSPCRCSSWWWRPAGGGSGSRSSAGSSRARRSG